MTSMLLEENSDAAKMKQELLNDRSMKEEARSFLSFSRENLSISHSDLEQGFNKSRLKPCRNTILSMAALVIALLCFTIESWKLRCLTANTHEIEQLKRDVEELKHRFLKQNLISDLKAFEEQLYDEKPAEDDDPGEADIDYADYDSNYDDDSSASHDYSGELPGNQRVPLTYGSRPSDFPETTSTPIPTSTKPHPDPLLQLVELMNKAAAERGQKLEKYVRENHKNIERKRLKEEHRARVSHEERSGDGNSTKHKRDILPGDTSSAGHSKSASRKQDESIKRKRSASGYGITTDNSTDTSNYELNDRHHARRTGASKMHPHASNEMTSDDSGANLTSSAVSWDVHPPKKYHAHARLDASSAADDDQLSEEIARANQHSGERRESVGGRSVNWRSVRRGAARDGTGSEIHGPAQNYEVVATEPPRKLARRHLRAPRQVYAIHYEADFNLFSAVDERDDNGKMRHHRGIFKSWRPSDWVAELGMNRYFTLASDGEITVHEAGLYLAYAQIHYVDEHDDNGFHLLVNGEPILQCMVHTPGAGHKSRSCFSAQVTYLQAGDRLVLKEVGAAKYALFHREKSFLGLVKLGETRQQQKHQQSQQS
ncbi:PREDICTED: uncharacterized protein LOC106748119 isoform X2 [Dinoponera quadriceps]|nr:PREDICTED: uncharacterized protein LOC106748119 isoform X2 [Dinoponera quadriceps]XP_014481839.1 PREDICTED: uncharacterized protein LOC106748119 isoform X2 [Dinoponera quadriceps]XP_014481840.1 PREDICTED: uncharacterized protein LOC106748119 isoform X2 [Dinoponera quadriceps]XP_014481841.1 PREDICTED: uncharacterized protein LOC106748119 isoform X2 [Dinoponera quadriceps]